MSTADGGVLGYRPKTTGALKREASGEGVLSTATQIKGLVAEKHSGQAPVIYSGSFSWAAGKGGAG